MREYGSGDHLFRVAAAASALPGEAVIRAPAGGSGIVITTTSGEQVRDTLGILPPQATPDSH